MTHEEPQRRPEDPRAPHNASPAPSKTSKGHLRAPEDLPRAHQRHPWTLEEPPRTSQGAPKAPPHGTLTGVLWEVSGMRRRGENVKG